LAKRVNYFFAWRALDRQNSEKLRLRVRSSAVHSPTQREV
jgi:hypothetical protein